MDAYYIIAQAKRDCLLKVAQEIYGYFPSVECQIYRVFGIAAYLRDAFPEYAPRL